MRMMNVFVVVASLTVGASTAGAQVTVEFQDGKVRLQAQGVSVSQILAEWARRGRTTIVNGERVAGPAVTLELQDTSEQQALDIVLRGVGGYLVAQREAAVAGASAFESIYILPTSSRPTNAAPLPPQQQQQAQQQIQSFDDDDAPPPPGAARGVNSGNAGARLPRDVADVRPRPDDDEDEPATRPATPATANPFGVAPGTSRPGVITPAPTTRPREQ